MTGYHKRTIVTMKDFKDKANFWYFSNNRTSENDRS